MPTPSKITQFQYSASENRREWDTKYVFENFQQNCVISGPAGAAVAGADGEVDVLQFPNCTLEMLNITANAILAPVISQVGAASQGVTGLAIDRTVTNTKGSEFCPSILSGNKSTFFPQISNPFFFRIRLILTTVANTAQMTIGWKSIQAYNDAFTNYTDYALINVNAGTLQSQTNLNNAGNITTVAQQTVLGSATVPHDYVVQVDGLGNVTYLLDGAPITYAAAPAVNPYQFRAGLQVVPFVTLVHNANGASVGAKILEWECGFQS